MGNFFKFLTKNYLDSDLIANYTYSSQNAGYPASNLQDPFRSKVWRSNAGYFDINSGNNQILINDGSDKLVSLTIQQVTSAATVASDMQTKFNAVSSGWTVTYNAFNKFSITRSSAGTIKWSDSQTTAATMLGFNNAVDDTGTSFEADEARICYPSEWLKFDFGTAKNPQAIVIIDNLEENIKIQPSITLELQGNVSDIWLTPSTVSLDYDSDNITKINIDGLFDQNYRYARLNIPDIRNPLGYLQLGKIYIGEVYELTGANVQREFQESYEDLSTSQRAIGGELYFDERPSFRRYENVTVYACNKDDVNLVKSIYNTHRTHTPFFVSVDSSLCVTDTISEWTRYVRFSSEPRYQTLTSNSWVISFALEELL